MSNAVWAEIVVQDALGNTVHLSKPAKRIVSLAPHNTENLFAAGAGDRLVGATLFSDYPPEAKKVPRIGGYTGLDMEAIIALQPDLILAWDSGNRKQDIEQLRSLGFTIFVSEPRKLEHIADEIESLGRLAGTHPTAHRFAEQFRKQLQQLHHHQNDAPPVEVFYEVWHQPLMTINGEQLISQAIMLCGGRNAFANLPTLAATVTLEAVLAANPEAIITSARSPTQNKQWQQRWRRWPQLQAVALNNLYSVPADLLQRQGPRILEGIKYLCNAIDNARERRSAQPKPEQSKPKS